MSKYKTKEEWIKLFREFETEDWDWEKYYVLVTSQKNLFNLVKYSIAFQKRKYCEYFKKIQFMKKLDNKFLKKKIETRGSKPKKDLDKIIDSLTKKKKMIL